MINPTSIASYNANFTGKLQRVDDFKENPPKYKNMSERKKHFGKKGTIHGKLSN